MQHLKRAHARGRQRIGPAAPCPYAFFLLFLKINVFFNCFFQNYYFYLYLDLTPHISFILFIEPLLNYDYFLHFPFFNIYKRKKHYLTCLSL
jgi:hypothetical protein